MLSNLKGSALSFFSSTKRPADRMSGTTERNSPDHKFISNTSSPALTFSTTLTSASTSPPFSSLPLIPHHATEPERGFAKLRSPMAPSLAAAFELARRSFALVSGRTKAGREEGRSVLSEADPDVILYPRNALELDRLQMSHEIHPSLLREPIKPSFMSRQHKSTNSRTIPTSTSFESAIYATSAHLPLQRSSAFPYHHVEGDFDAVSTLQPSSLSCYSCESVEAEAFDEPGSSGRDEDLVNASNALRRRLSTSARYYDTSRNPVSFFESDADSDQDADMEQRRPRTSSDLKRAVMDWTLTLGRNVSAAGHGITPTHNGEEAPKAARPLTPKQKGKGRRTPGGSSSSFSRHRSKIPFPLKIDSGERAEDDGHDWTLSLDLPWNRPLASSAPSPRAGGSSSGPPRFPPSSLGSPSYTQARGPSLRNPVLRREAALVSTFSLSPTASELAREREVSAATRRASVRFSARPGDIISWILARAGARFGLRRGDK